jgi:hypothetical protein
MLGKNSKIALSMLKLAIADSGQPLPSFPEYPANTIGVTVEQWRLVFTQHGMPGEKPETIRKTFKRARDDLIASQIIGSLNNHVWFVRRSDE